MGSTSEGRHPNRHIDTSDVVDPSGTIRGVCGEAGPSEPAKDEHGWQETAADEAGVTNG